MVLAGEGIQHHVGIVHRFGGLLLVEGDGERQGLACAVDRDLGGVAGGEGAHRGLELGIAAHLGIAHLGDDIAGLQPGLFGGAVLIHGVDIGAERHVVVLGVHGVVALVQAHAHIGLAGHIALGDQIVGDGGGVVDGDCKAQTLGVGLAGLGGDNADEYKFAKLVEKMRSVSPKDGTYQQKIYNFFKNGVNGTKISESDLQWFINYMLGPLQVNSDTKISIEKGETSQIDARIVNYRPGLPNPVITYQTSDPAVATVSETGLITAVRGGTAQITVQVDGFTEIITVNVEKVESELPAGIVYGDNGYVIKGKNIVKNGSFEYADGLSDWKDGTGAEVSADNFSLQTYPDSEDRYLESKADGDETSVNSISMSWRISARKTYVFGYKVKNSTDIQTNNNQNLKILLYKSSGTKEVEVYPSYDGNWKEVQYVFTNSDSYTKLQIHFSHLSQNGNNTCLDNFYLAEVEVSTDVDQIRLDPTDGAVYDLNGRKVGGVVDGIIIRDGKKYLIK